MDAGRLESIALFSGLTLNQREKVAGLCEEISVEAGDTLLREGDFGYAVFAITSGTAEVRQGGEPIRTLGPGEVFGEIAVLSGGRRTADGEHRRDLADDPRHGVQPRPVATRARDAGARGRATSQDRDARRADSLPLAPTSL